MKSKLTYFFCLCALITFCSKANAQQIPDNLIGTWKTDSIWVKSTVNKITSHYKYSPKQRSYVFQKPINSLKITVDSAYIHYADGSIESGPAKSDDGYLKVDIMVTLLNLKYKQILKHLTIEQTINYVTDGINPTQEEFKVYLNNNTQLK